MWWFSFIAIFLPFLPESKYFLRDLAVRPRLLAPENLSDGYISPTQFYNHFHDGMAAPYLKNPTYIIIVDFRYFFLFFDLIINGVGYQLVITIQLD